MFNSKSAAAGQIAICLKLWELCEADLTFEEVVRKTEEFIASMKTFFLLETLDVFRKNGRLSHLQALVTDTLKIKLIMGADAEGAIEMKGKALTFQIALRKMADQIKKLCGDGAKDRVLCITHCKCRERAQKVVELIREAGFKKAVICAAGGISTMYANKGGLIVDF